MGWGWCVYGIEGFEVGEDFLRCYEFFFKKKTIKNVCVCV